MIDLETLAIAKKYTDNSIAGGGISAGKNCTIKSITDITGGHRVTFEWTLDNGTVQTDTMDVMDGEKGNGIKSIIKTATVENVDTYTITFDDDTTETFDVTNGENGHGVPEGGTKGQILKKKSNTDYDTEWVDPTGETSTLDGLADVNLGTLEDGQVLKYDAASGKWINGSGGIVEVSMSDIKDVDLTSLADGDILVYVASTQKWTRSNALSNKVDKVNGKGLSTNDYDDTEKAEVAKIANKADAVDVVDGASYDSTNHSILFKHGSTTLFSLDAAAFVKDGMVDDVEISGGNLVITFNTDAGKQAISIPLTDIFDPANYYDKDDVDGLLADKADKTSVIQFKTTTETDANNLWEETGYYIVNTSDMTNLPTTDASMGYCLEVIRYGSLSNSLVVQIAYRGNPTTENPIYMRRRFNDVWTDWVAIAKKSEVTGKADKVASATNGDFAGLDANGNLTDSGKKASDFGTADEIADIVNVYGAKNLIPYPFWSNNQASPLYGVSYTINADGSITFSGTSTQVIWFGLCGRINYEYPLSLKAGKYIISCAGLPSEVSSYVGIFEEGNTAPLARATYTDPEGLLELETDKDVFVGFRIPTNFAIDTTIKPMLRMASIKDDTYVLYVPTNAKLNEEKMSYADNGVLGAKNLLQNTATTQTINNVAFTVNSDDKTVKVTRTAEQTEIATRDLYVVSDEDYKLLAGKTLLMTGCPSGGSNDTYYLECYYNDGTGHWLRDIGNGLTITLPATKPTTIKFLIGIKVASVIPSGGLTFKPMLRLASDSDDTYQPYAMTNKELTDRVTQSVSSVIRDTTTTNSASIKLYRYGNLRILTGNFNPSVAGTSVANTHIADLPLATDYPTYNAFCTCGRGETDSSTTAKIGSLNIGTDGTIKYQGQATGENMFFNITWLVE